MSCIFLQPGRGSPRPDWLALELRKSVQRAVTTHVGSAKTHHRTGWRSLVSRAARWPRAAAMHPCRPQTQTLQSLSRRTIAFDGLAEPDAGDGRLSWAPLCHDEASWRPNSASRRVNGLKGNRIDAMPPIWELRSEFTASYSPNT